MPGAAPPGRLVVGPATATRAAPRQAAPVRLEPRDAHAAPIAPGLLLAPAAQVGACIVSQDHIILGIGYNGFPRGCADGQLPWAKKHAGGDQLATKYPYVVHAEANALLNKNAAVVEGAVGRRRCAGARSAGPGAGVAGGRAGCSRRRGLLLMQRGCCRPPPPPRRRST